MVGTGRYILWTDAEMVSAGWFQQNYRRTQIKMKTTGPEQTVEELDDIIAVWEKNSDFTLGPNLNLKKLQATRDGLDKSVADVKSLKRQLTEETDNRDDLNKLGKEYVTRVRKGIHGYFGGDSTEYAQAGGTRASERKRPGRKAKSADAKKAA